MHLVVSSAIGEPGRQVLHAFAPRRHEFAIGARRLVVLLDQLDLDLARIRKRQRDLWAPHRPTAIEVVVEDTLQDKERADTERIGPE